MSEEDGTPEVLASTSPTEASTPMTMDELTSAVRKMQQQMAIIVEPMDQSIKDKVNAIAGGRRRRSRRGKRPRKSRRSRRH
jgi:hypothetical protein